MFGEPSFANFAQCNLGIVAGRGVLPQEIARIYSDLQGKVYIAALEGEADVELIKDFPHRVFKIGSVGGVIDYFKKHQVHYLIFIGGIKRPDLAAVKVDFEGAALIAKIIKQKFLGDDEVLKTVAKFFEEKGFKVIAANEIMKQQTSLYKYTSNLLTHKIPSKQDSIDIEIGLKVLRSLSPFDVGQGVIVENGHVIGIEAAEGTDQLVKRCSDFRSSSAGGVLIKMMKIGQDNRLDIPVIGPETIKNVAKEKYHGVAIEKEKVILIDQDNTVKLANEYGIFILRF